MKYKHLVPINFNLLPGRVIQCKFHPNVIVLFRPYRKVHTESDCIFCANNISRNTHQRDEKIPTKYSGLYINTEVIQEYCDNNNTGIKIHSIHSFTKYHKVRAEYSCSIHQGITNTIDCDKLVGSDSEIRVCKPCAMLSNVKETIKENNINDKEVLYAYQKSKSKSKTIVGMRCLTHNHEYEAFGCQITDSIKSSKHQTMCCKECVTMLILNTIRVSYIGSEDQQTLYLYELYNENERYLKIGIRRPNLKRHYKGLKYSVLYEKDSDADLAFKTETKIKKEFANIKATTESKFSGYTECFVFLEDNKKAILEFINDKFI